MIRLRTGCALDVPRFELVRGTSSIGRNELKRQTLMARLIRCRAGPPRSLDGIADCDMPVDNPGCGSGRLCSECSPKYAALRRFRLESGQSPRKFPICRTGSFTYPRVESYIEFVKRLYTSSM